MNSVRRTRRGRVAALALAAMTALGAARSLYADTFVFIGNSGDDWYNVGDWFDENNFSFTQIPQHDDDVTVSAAGHWVGFGGLYTPSGDLDYITVDGNPGTSFAPFISQSGGTMSAIAETFGENFQGGYQQGGGSNYTHVLLMAVDNSGSSGGYALFGTGYLSTLDEEYIGGNGIGTFNQQGNTSNYAGDIELGRGGAPNGQGIYDLSGGYVNANSMEMYGNGTTLATETQFNQSGGTVVIGGQLSFGLSMGDGLPVNAAYSLSGGLLQTNSEVICTGLATIAQSGSGSQNITNSLSVGSGNFADLGTTAGTYNLQAGTLRVNGTEIVGDTSGDIGEFFQNGGSHTVSANLYIGNNGGATGTYDFNAQFGGTLNVTGYEAVGYNGTGTFTQAGGTNTTNQVVLGFNSGGSGSYTLSGGNLTSTFNENVGYIGSGTFTQTGGTHTVGSFSSNADLVVGTQNTSHASSFNLSSTTGASALNVYGNFYIGYAASVTGSVTQTGGSVNVSSNVFDDVFVGYNGFGSYTLGGTGSLSVNGALEVANGAASMGTFSLTGGSVHAGWEYVGVQTLGTFTQSGGTHQIDSFLSLGTDAGSGANGHGVYNLQSGMLNIGGGGGTLGVFIGDAGTGTFNQTGGTFTSSVPFYVSYGAGSNGNYSLSNNGSLAVANTESIGYRAPGTFTQSGGTNTVGSGGSPGNLYIGEESGSSGTYTLSNTGVLRVTSSEFVGCFGNGNFIQNGGTNTVVGGLYVASDASNVSGTYTMTGGSLIVGYETIGLAGMGVLNESGNNTISTDLIIADDPDSTGTLNLHSGTLHDYGNTYVGGEIGSMSGGLGALNTDNGSVMNVDGNFVVFPTGTFTNAGNFTLGGNLTSTSNANITNAATGTVTLLGGPTVQLNGTGWLINSGSFYLGGATITGGGAGAQVQNNASGTLQGPGTINVGFGNNYGTVFTPYGTLSLSGTFQNYGTVQLGNGGVLNPATFSDTGTTYNYGIIRGNGTVSPSSLINHGTIQVDAQSLTLQTNLDNATDGTLASPGPATTLIVNSSFTNDGLIHANGGAITVNGDLTGAGNVTVENNSSFSVEHLSQSSLTINGSGTATVTGGGPVIASTLSSLSIAGTPGSYTGRLDLGATELILGYGATDPISTIASYLLSGYNHGAWNGKGIDSSTAALPANNAHYGLGYADGADGVVAGLISGQIEIKYTLLGDADLDGSVTGSDFTILAAHLGKTVSGWDKGDFDYDGSVTGSDFTALVANLGKTASGTEVVLPASDYAAIDAFAAANGLSLPSVPEPASLAVIAFGAMGLLARRRRRV